MLVAQILKDKGRDVFRLSPDESLAQAARDLVQKGVGALIVTDGERVVGVLSERDVVRALASEGGGALDHPVSRHMTRDVVFAEPADGVDVLMSRMTDRRIRHLPVLKDGALCGVVSIGDVVKCQIADVTQEAESLKSYILNG